MLLVALRSEKPVTNYYFDYRRPGGGIRHLHQIKQNISTANDIFISMKMIKLQCAHCDNLFDKKLKEYKRQIKNGATRFFCNLSCNALTRNKEHPPPGNPQYLIADNRRDNYTQFRWFVRRGEYRNKKKGYGCDLTVEYLKDLWEKQKGICPFTGWNLILPKDSESFESKNIANASVDRIDNSKGYMEGNVRFISVMANLARQAYTDEQLIKFCKDVASYQ